MPVYSPQNPFRVRRLVVSPKQQAAFGTVLADAALTLAPDLPKDAFLEITPEYQSNREWAGKGHPFATQRPEISRATAFAFSGWLTATLAGWLAAFALGKVETSGAGPYEHVFNFLAAAEAMPVTTLYCEDASDIKFKAPDFAINDLTISASNKGPVQFQANMMGSGRHTDVAMVDPPDYVDPTYLQAADAVLKIGNVGALVDVTYKMLSWSIKIANQLDLHYAPGGAGRATQCNVGQQTATLQFTIALDAADPLRAAWLAGTPQQIQIAIGNAVTIDFAKTLLSAAKIGVDGNKEIISCEINEDSFLQSGSDEPLTVTVNNAVAAYLVAV